MDASVAILMCSHVPVLIFTPAHGCLCWCSQLIICPHVAIHIWSYIPCWYSPMIMYTCVAVHSWSFIPTLVFVLGQVFTVFIFILSYMSPCWYSYLVIHLHVDNHTYSCLTILLFSPGHISQCWYSHYFCILVFVFLFGHESPSCYSYLVIWCSVAILTWSFVSIFIFTLGHESQCW